MRLRILGICAALLATLVAVAACGVPKSGGFTDIDRSKIPSALNATTTTSTTTTTTTTTIPETTTTVGERVMTGRRLEDSGPGRTASRMAVRGNDG